MGRRIEHPTGGGADMADPERALNRGKVSLPSLPPQRQETRQIQAANGVIRFFVPGTPRPQGSKVGFRTKYGKVVVKDMCEDLEAWRATVAAFARRAYQGKPLAGPVRMDLVLLMPRPKSHFRAGDREKGLKASAPGWHAQTPDRTKLLRSVEDSLKGILWQDDSQVVDGAVKKVFADGLTGVDVTVKPAGDWHGA